METGRELAESRGGKAFARNLKEADFGSKDIRERKRMERERERKILARGGALPRQGLGGRAVDGMMRLGEAERKNLEEQFLKTPLQREEAYRETLGRADDVLHDASTYIDPATFSEEELRKKSELWRAQAATGYADLPPDYVVDDGQGVSPPETNSLDVDRFVEASDLEDHDKMQFSSILKDRLAADTQRIAQSGVFDDAPGDFHEGKSLEELYAAHAAKNNGKSAHERTIDNVVSNSGLDARFKNEYAQALRAQFAKGKSTAELRPRPISIDGVRLQAGMTGSIHGVVADPFRKQQEAFQQKVLSGEDAYLRDMYDQHFKQNLDRRIASVGKQLKGVRDNLDEINSGDVQELAKLAFEQKKNASEIVETWNNVLHFNRQEQKALEVQMAEAIRKVQLWQRDSESNRERQFSQAADVFDGATLTSNYTERQ